MFAGRIERWTRVVRGGREGRHGGRSKLTSLLREGPTHLSVPRRMFAKPPAFKLGCGQPWVSKKGGENTFQVPL